MKYEFVVVVFFVGPFFSLSFYFCVCVRVKTFVVLVFVALLCFFLPSFNLNNCVSLQYPNSSPIQVKYKIEYFILLFLNKKNNNNKMRAKNTHSRRF